MDTIGPNFVIGIVVVYLMEMVKRLRVVPWITQETRRLNRVLALVVAAAAAIGIHFSFDASAGVLTVSGLTLQGVLHGLYEFAKQAAMQQFAYDVAIEPKRRRREAGLG